MVSGIVPSGPVGPGAPPGPNRGCSSSYYPSMALQESTQLSFRCWDGMISWRDVGMLRRCMFRRCLVCLEF